MPNGDWTDITFGIFTDGGRKDPFDKLDRLDVDGLFRGCGCFLGLAVTAIILVPVLTIALVAALATR